MKECNKCHEVKPLESFHRKNSSKDGRRGNCIQCRNKTNLRITHTEWSAERLEQELKKFPGWRQASPYVKCDQPVRLKCVKCGHSISVPPKDIVKAERFKGFCRECLRLKKGREFVAELLKADYYPQFKPEDYGHNQEPMEVICSNGTRFTTTYRDFMATTRPRRGCSCSVCKEKPKTHKRRSEIEARSDLEEHGFILAGTYKDTHTHVMGFWVSCGHYDYLRPVCIFIRKAGCQTCYNQRRSEIIKAALKV